MPNYMVNGACKPRVRKSNTCRLRSFDHIAACKVRVMRYHVSMMRIVVSVCCLVLMSCSNGQDTGQKKTPPTDPPAAGTFDPGKRQAYDAVGVAGGKDTVSPFGKPANNAYTSEALKDAIREQEQKQQ